MAGNEFVWIASIILGLTLLGWLVLDWLESAQQWENYDVDPNNMPLGRSEQQAPDALDMELELMLSYPLDPFAPALLWRPLPQDQWVETQDSAAESLVTENAPEPPIAPQPSEAA
jgi:hypothetical protein